jgi:hypothetical protein
MKLFAEFPFFNREKKQNQRQDSQKTLYLSENELVSFGLFLNNIDMNANNKASMKEIVKLLKNPEPLLGGKSVTEFDYLNHYGRSVSG